MASVVILTNLKRVAHLYYLSLFFFFPQNTKKHWRQITRHLFSTALVLSFLKDTWKLKFDSSYKYFFNTIFKQILKSYSKVNCCGRQYCQWLSSLTSELIPSPFVIVSKRSICYWLLVETAQRHRLAPQKKRSKTEFWEYTCLSCLFFKIILVGRGMYHFTICTSGTDPLLSQYR